MHTVFCIIGRTASGKSTIANAFADKLGLTILKSYTTRARRKNEVGDKCDHTFIKPEEVEQYRNDMVAYTERAGYCSFATLDQLMHSDIYIINPSGYSDLIKTTANVEGLHLIDVWIDCDEDKLYERSKNRSKNDNWKENYEKEQLEFNTIYPNVDYSKSYHVDNNNSIWEAVKSIVNIAFLEWGGKNKLC